VQPARKGDCLLFSRGNEVQEEHHGLRLPQVCCLHSSGVAETQYKCPFTIRFSLIGVVAAHKHPDVFHEVKITQTNFEHTCQLSPTFLREAQRKGGHLKLDIPSLKMALDLLCLHPTTKARILRPYLVRALPNWHALDSSYVSNFCKRAVKYWIIHGSYDDEDTTLTSADAETLISTTTAADENSDIDDEAV
jgi:hypothetical protein